MRKFDYPITCPEIDRNINHFEDSLERSLEDIFEQLYPFVDDSTITAKFQKQWLKEILPYANQLFENVRECNLDMRREAEKIIDDANSEIDALNDTIKQLEYELRVAENRIDELEDEVISLEGMIENH